MKAVCLQVAILVLVPLITPPLLAADCGKLGKQYYNKGLELGKSEDWKGAKEALTQSLKHCNRFNNWYLLGRVEMELSDMDDAATAFETARRYASDSNEQAVAIARYAEVQSKQGLIDPPLQLLREAAKLHSNAPQWITTLQKDLDQKRVSKPLTIAQVTGALNNKSISLFKISTKPSLNVSILFEYDSTKVVTDSKESINVLGAALMDNSLQGKKVTIIGHTDRRGKNKYNKQLSKQRAAKIAHSLFKQYPELRSRVTVVGAGEATPLYKGNTEWDYQMNRRIEVQLEN
jgi:outer membrane protein OmpA-like peptidoglycan-associated protein